MSHDDHHERKVTTFPAEIFHSTKLILDQGFSKLQIKKKKKRTQGIRTTLVGFLLDEFLKTN